MSVAEENYAAMALHILIEADDRGEVGLTADEVYERVQALPLTEKLDAIARYQEEA